MINEGKLGQLLFDIVFTPDTAKESFLTLNEDEKKILFELCARNSVDIQMARFLIQQGLSGPDTILKKAEFELRRSHARFEKTKSLIIALQAESIEVIALKGTAIGIGLLGNPHYKRMNDFDFLVKPGKVRKAIQVITRMGYQDTSALFGKPVDVEADYHAPPFFSQEGSNILGLHWHLVSKKKKFKFDTEALWARSEALEKNGMARRLCWEDYLLHFAAHQNPYKFGIRELADLALVLDRAPIDEKKLHELAEQSNAKEELISVLSALHPFYSKKNLGFELKKENTSLPFYRTLLISQVEKQFALSRLSKYPEAQFTHWAQMWKLCLGASDWDLRALFHLPPETPPGFFHRIRAPFRCLKIIAGDHGPILIGIVTLAHAIHALGCATRVYAKKAIGIHSKNQENPILQRVNDLE